MKSFFAFFLFFFAIVIVNCQTIPSCDIIKFYWSPGEAAYGECSSCYNVTNPLTPMRSYYIDCTIGKIATYTSPGCVVSTKITEIAFDPFGLCAVPPCCLMKVYDASPYISPDANTYNLARNSKCSNTACFGIGDFFGNYYKKINSTTYTVHKNSACSDAPVADTLAIRVCDLPSSGTSTSTTTTSSAPMTSDASSTTTVATSSTGMITNFISKSEANLSRENILGVFSLFVIYLLFV